MMADFYGEKMGGLPDRFPPNHKLRRIWYRIKRNLYLIGAIFILIGFYFLLQKNYRKLGKYSFFIGIYIILNKVILIISKPIRIYGKTQSVRWWKAVCTQFADYIEVPFSLPTFFLGVCLFFITAIMIYEYHGKFETFFKTLFMILSIAILFTGDQMKMNGTAYIILFAFLIRSLPHRSFRCCGTATN
jgi:iron(III) transport system permease protein